MSSLKRMLGLSMIAAAVADFGKDPKRNLQYVESNDEREARMKLAEERQNKANGLQQFHYGYGNIVWAINQKNADKKARKLNWI